MPKERVTNRIDRRIVCGERTMVAHVYLQQGAVVPRHSHHNEQLTYILKGKLRFWVGDDLSQVFDVAAGEVLRLPSNVPHKAEALEETLDVDIIQPAAAGLARPHRRLLPGAVAREAEAGAMPPTDPPETRLAATAFGSRPACARPEDAPGFH